MRASNEVAMTAPGSQPVDVMESAGHYFSNDPTITPSNKAKIAPGKDGKPQASGQAGKPQGSARWTSTSTPDVIRRAER